MEKENISARVFSLAGASGGWCIERESILEVAGRGVAKGSCWSESEGIMGIGRKGFTLMLGMIESMGSVVSIESAESVDQAFSAG